MSFESVDLYVNDTTPTANPVAGVTVKVLSQDGTILFTQTVTDSGGHAGLLLPAASPGGTTYQLRLYKFQVGVTNPQYIQVLPSPLSPGQTNSFDVLATILTPPIPLDARLCTAFGYFRDVTGAPQEGVEIHFIAKFDPVWLDGSAVLKERVIICTDRNGYAQTNLIRNGQYDVTVAGEEDITRHINVPDAPNVNLPDLLFPIVSQIVLSPAGPYSLVHGTEQTLSMQVLGSDGETLGTGIGDILIAISDNTILSYTITQTALTLIGVAPGTAQLTITRADTSIIHIPDPGILNGVINVTVT